MSNLIKTKKSFSISRIYRFLTENNRNFSIISAERGENSMEENNRRTSNLQKDIRELKLGFIKVKGGYTETLEEGSTKDVTETSFLVPNILKEDAIKLGKKYQQESIFWKDDSIVAYIDCQSGLPTKKFKNDLSTQKEAIKTYFTQFKNRGKRKFVFLSEENEPSLFSAYSSKLGKYEQLDLSK